MSSLQDKMTNYEIVPPAGVWDRINAALDKGLQENEFPGRLYNLEIDPPSTTWNTIESSLDTEETPVVTFRKRNLLFIRYAAAAILIGVIAIGIVKWTTDSAITKGAAIAKKDSLNDRQAPATAKTEIPFQEKDQPDQQTAIAQENKDIFARLNPLVKSQAHKNNSRTATASYPYEEAYDDQYSNPIYAYEDHMPEIADRYIMLMTPDGNIIRMSKKLSNLVCCVSGEEQDADCKSQLKKWQEKMAASSLSTSSDNFLDILNLVGSLQDAGEL